ncbi:MAG: RNA polymerase sigma factor [Elusimicrobia bacterium]|nr:RNA polymerase sigma factor [Elusimicrobiota bacterium]
MFTRIFNKEPSNNNSKLALFERLLKEHGDKVHSLACRLTGNKDLAADLTQEAFLRVLENIERYDTSKPFENWVHVILRNLYFDWIKRYENSHAVSLNGHKDGNNRELGEILPLPEADPLGQAMNREKQTLVQKALKALPAEFRMPLLLCDSEDLSYEEISRILNCPIGTVRSRIHRARKMLKEILQPSAGGILS